MNDEARSKKDLFKGVEAPPLLREDPSTVLKPCALCGARDARRLFMQAHFPIVRCRQCSLIYADEHFRQQDLEAFYSGDYYERAYICHAKEIDKKLAGNYARAFDPVDRSLGGGRLLDFGCARGSFLEALRERGYGERWELEGLDMNADEVGMGRSRGLRIACGTLETAGYEDGRFDAVSAFSVIEHLQDPLGELRRLARIIRPGGALLVIVPSGNCLIVTLALLAEQVLGRRAQGFTDNVFHEEHLYYFTRRTLARALRETGFEPVRFFHAPCYLETHPPGFLVALGAYGLRFLSFLLRRQTMLGVVARRQS